LSSATNPELSILMPAFNEEATIERAIERVLEADLGVDSYELLVVENGSLDSTRRVLTEREWPAEVKPIFVDRNRGKGDAIRRALPRAAGTFSVILDADLEYDPADIAKLVQPLRDGSADAAMGTRFFHSHSAYGFWYVIGGRSVTLAANALYDAWISDILNCYKAMPTDRFRSLQLREDGFAIDAEIPARLLRDGAKIYEVPVDYMARTQSEGKKLRPRDAAKIIWTLLRCRWD
jgi:dolichol-phosphate hexosyltransferase